MKSVCPIYVNKCLFDDWDKVDGQVDGVEFFDMLEFGRIDASAPAFLFGSINNCKLSAFPDWRNRLPHLCFAYHRMAVSDYFDVLGDLQLNYRTGYFKRVGELDGTDIDNFCRSDSSDKVWAGQLLTATILDIMRERVAPETLMFLAEATVVKDECRCWAWNGELVACSGYSPFADMHELEYDSEVDESRQNWLRKVVREVFDKMGNSNFVKSPVDNGDFPIVVDMAVDKHGQLKVVELNCFSTSGFNNINAFKNVVRHTQNKMRLDAGN